MKKILTFLAAALAICSCRVYQADSSYHTESNLFYFSEKIVLATIEDPVFAILSADRDKIFNEGYRDTVATYHSYYDAIIIAKVP